MKTVSSYSHGEIARVYLLDAPFCIDHAYDYFIPPNLQGLVKPGVFVTLPFGNGNRRQIGLVRSLPEKTDFGTLKPLSDICPVAFSLDDTSMELCFYMKEQTLCTVGDAVRCLIPAAALSRLVEYYRPAQDKKFSAGDSSPAELLVYKYICERGFVSSDALKARFGTAVDSTVRILRDGGFIERDTDLKTTAGEPTRTVYRLNIDDATAIQLLSGVASGSMKLSSCKQKSIVELLRRESPLSADDICIASGSGKSVLQALCAKGILISEKIPANSGTVYDTEGERTEIRLSSEQEEALSQLNLLADSGQPKAALLHGVTGSGKTSVMLRLIDSVLDKGRCAIVLLPEIALTPQSLDIFCRRYGKLVSVVHSGLSAGERLASWRAAQTGKARVVIGTRSAVFAPVQDLGVLIIDEEQEHTYKSDQNPKYHARDIARWRCAHSNALLLLASATPSLESYMRACSGRYSLIKLKNRYGDAKLPEVTIADMRGEAQSGNITPLGKALSQELVRNFNQKNQSVLFLNRRGYNHLISCRSCGTAVTCPHCSVAMNYHTRKGTYDEGDLVCHWCGCKMPLPDKCPSCGSTHMVHLGFGTQRVEQELGDMLPGAVILRMDADTTTTKNSRDEILTQFRRHKADVLLGTQMVTKGHDFPDVTLVGVLLADASLYLDDYRANEQTFSLLTQVIGRAGRASKPGLAIIQTNNPDSDVIKLACAQDYETFYAREIKLRELLVFPPFCDIAMLTVTSADEKELTVCAQKAAEELESLTKTGGEFSDVATVVFGPFEAPVYKVDKKFRMRIIVKCRLNRRSRELFAYLLTRFGAERGKPILSIDFNPSSLS